MRTCLKLLARSLRVFLEMEKPTFLDEKGQKAEKKKEREREKENVTGLGWIKLNVT